MKVVVILSLLTTSLPAYSDTQVWNVVFKNASENKKVPLIDRKITRITNDIYCLKGEVPKKSDESFFYKSMPRLVADCVYLKEHFQLYSFCDLKRNISISKQSLKSSDFSVFLECSNR